jgi:hypothetical protein
MSVGVLKAVTSIIITITNKGLKPRNVVSTVVKIDRNLLSDASATYKKTFIFTLAPAFSVYSFVAVC